MNILNHPIIFAVVAIVSWPLYVSIGKLFFGGNFNSLSEMLKYIIHPSGESFSSNEHISVWFTSTRVTKILFYIFLCVGWPAAITELIVRHVL